MTDRPVWLSILLLLALGRASYAAETLTHADGSRYEGEVRLDTAGRLTVRPSGQTSVDEFDLDDIERVVFREASAPKAADKPCIEFRNGDRLHASIRSLESAELVAMHAALGELKIRPTALFRLNFSGRNDTGHSRREAGALLTSGVFIPGRLVQIQQDRLWVRHDTLGLTQTPTDQVAQAIIHDELVYQTSSDSVQAVIVFTSGEMLSGSLQGLDEHTIRLSVAWHLREPADFQFDRGDVAEIFFVNGRIRYLSEMTPVEVKRVPYFSYVAPLERNANALGGPLRIAARTYPRGLGCQSKTEAVYKLEGRYQWFRSDVGLDGRLGAGGDVEFKVFADSTAGEPVFQANVSDAKTLRSTGNIDVSSVRRLVLVVDYGAGGSVEDFATWGNACLIRKPESSEDSSKNQ